MKAFLTDAMQSCRAWYLRLLRRLFPHRHDAETILFTPKQDTSHPVTVNQRCRHLLGLMGDMNR